MAKRPSRSRSQADDTAAGSAPEPAPRRTPRARPAAAGKPTGGSTAAVADSEISAADTGPREEDIRLRAYHRYLERGGGHGMDFDDWLEAERELSVGKRKSEV